MSSYHLQARALELPPSAGRIVMRNAISHFRARASSWYMAIVNLAIGIVMTVNPDGITDNPGADVYLAYANRIASPDVWRALFLAIGLARLLALIVNGSFPRVWWTPHIRMVLSGLSAVVWLQFAISVCLTTYPAFATVLFPAAVILELWNTAVAASETKRKPEGHFG